MSPVPNRRNGRAPLLGMLVLLSWAACASAAAPDRYDAAVQHAGRSDADHKRDAIDHPAEILRLAGIREGMQVADVLAGDGYYSELASYLVGARGHVLLLNNAAFEKWSGGGWEPRLANGRLPNVEHRVAELEHLQLGERALDAVLLIKVYHDLYWKADREASWPGAETPAVLDALVRALKPGGVLVVVDHSAVAGSGRDEAGRLHRIDERYAVRDFESRGLHRIGSSDVLRRADDPRDQISYKEPMIGKTDRFVLVFRK